MTRHLKIATLCLALAVPQGGPAGASQAQSPVAAAASAQQLVDEILATDRAFAAAAAGSDTATGMIT